VSALGVNCGRDVGMDDETLANLGPAWPATLVTLLLKGNQCVRISSTGKELPSFSPYRARRR
jgi:hypothetical protein